MQALGKSQTIVTTPGVDAPPPSTTTPSTTTDVQVGKQTTTTAASTAKEYPGLTAKFKGTDTSSRRILTKGGLEQALGITPSSSAKAKTFFASGFNKIAKGLGYDGVRKSDFVELTKATNAYAKAKEANASPGELLSKLYVMRDKLESHQARHPGKLENADEVLDMVKVEIAKQELLSEIADLDLAPNPAGKAAIYAGMMKEYDQLACKNPSCFTQPERAATLKMLAEKIEEAAAKEGLPKLPEASHKEIMKGIQSAIREHASTTKSSTLLRANTDVMMSKPHSFMTVNTHMDTTILKAIDSVKGEALEVNPAKLSKEDVDGGKVERNQAKLISAFNGICDDLGISSDKTVRDKGVAALPQELCDQAKCLYDEIIRGGHGDAEARKAVASMIMLKLVCPILMTPQSSDASPHQILDQPLDSSTQRNVTLLAKMLQNLANEVSNNGKEPYMVPVNQVQVGRLPAWQDFVGAVVARGRDVDSL